MPPALRKDLQLIMLRAQRSVGITAGKFCFMNMEQFGEVSVAIVCENMAENRLIMTQNPFV